MKYHKIDKIEALEVIDSRGVPTVMTRITLENGVIGQAEVPSGASTGRYEAHEKRDGKAEFNGKGVGKAIHSITTEIAECFIENQPKSIAEADTLLRKLDGTENKSRLGANAILSTSLAFARARASEKRLPLFEYLGGINGRLLPIPMMNLLNGGAHACNNLDIQEFMIVPIKAHNFKDAVRIGCEIYTALKRLLTEKGLSVSVGDEGGFAPNLQNDRAALELLCDAIKLCGCTPGVEVSLALDIAASEWYEGEVYRLPKQNTQMTKDELFQFYEGLCCEFPIISIEDPFHEDDFPAFARFRERNPKIQVVGDDLFVTNPDRIRQGILQNSASAVLIKPNQIGTLTETLHAISLAQQNGYRTIISHRSGDTPDPFIADLAVATNAGQIKTGAPCRGERIAKYNRLIEIEAILSKNAYYGNF